MTRIYTPLVAAQLDNAKYVALHEPFGFNSDVMIENKLKWLWRPPEPWNSKFPAIPGELERITPQFVEFSGWTEDLTGVRSWYDLPVNARLYLDAISEIVGCPISIVSIGPERMQTLFFSGAKFLKNFIAEEG